MDGRDVGMEGPIWSDLLRVDTDEQNYSQKRFIRVFGALGESVCDIAATMIDFTRLEIRSNLLKE